MNGLSALSLAATTFLISAVITACRNE
ncbi:Vmc-like lipoprotein signal peptide domain-containing protein [Paenibacillus sp. FSL H8-0259]